VKTLTQTVLALLLPLAAVCAHAQTLRIDGSAAGASISNVAAAEFRKQKKDASIAVGISGSGGGLAKLCRSEAEMVTTTRPIQASEIDACAKAKIEFIELPIAFDAVTIIVNAGNSFVDRLSVEDLRKMWQASAQSAITHWDQIDPRWPHLPMKLLGPDRLSDESSYFNAAILGGEAPRRDTMASAEDRILIQGVARDANTLSFVSLAYYLENRAQLKAVPIAAKAGATPVAPTFDAIAKGAYQPLARPLFLYVNVKALENTLMREFAEFTLANGARLAKVANTVPLAESTYRLDLERLRARSTGTVWAGAVPIGLTLQTLEKPRAAP
jgi:phosphate transport system substrate-binding protein